MIMRVALISSGRVGQVTFLSSSRTATRKPAVRWNHPVQLGWSCSDLHRLHGYLDSLCA